MEESMKPSSPPSGPSGSHAGEPKAREAYQSPTLIEYGSVAKLTQGTLTTGGDGKLGGFKSKACL